MQTFEKPINLRGLGDYDALNTQIKPIEVTHTGLKNYIRTGRLIPGKLYRVTDYCPTGNIMNGNTKIGEWAGHAFDIIVQAFSSRELCWDARCAPHDGDTYFDNAFDHMRGWRVNYNYFENSISWMCDEHGNEAYYDFKNALFLRYAVTEIADSDIITKRQAMLFDATHPVCYAGAYNPAMFTQIDTTEDRLYYTFTAIGPNQEIWDASTFNCIRDDYQTTGVRVYNNKIGALPVGGAHDGAYVLTRPNNVVFIIGHTSGVIADNVVGYGSNNCTIGQADSSLKIRNNDFCLCVNAIITAEDTSEIINNKFTRIENIVVIGCCSNNSCDGMIQCTFNGGISYSAFGGGTYFLNFYAQLDGCSFGQSVQHIGDDMAYNNILIMDAVIGSDIDNVGIEKATDYSGDIERFSIASGLHDVMCEVPAHAEGFVHFKNSEDQDIVLTPSNT